MTTVAHTDHGASHGSAGWVSAAPLLVLIELLVLGYLLAAACAPRRWHPWRTAAWIAGCAVLAVAVSPLPGGYGDPRTHMAQHLLLGMLAPLGLVLAAPVTLLLRVASPRSRHAVARMLRSRPVHLIGHPVTAALLSTGGLYLVMLTPLYAAAGNHPVVHHGLHLHYLAAGYLFTWSVAGPDPAPRRPGMTVRVSVLIGAAAAHAFLAKYLYAHADVLPPGAMHHDTGALHAAAQLMYYGGDVGELLLAVALFAGWYRRRTRRPSGPGTANRATAVSARV